MKKKSIIIVVIVLIIVGIIAINSNKKPNDGLKYNNNKSFTKKQTVEGIVFKNIKCTYDGKNSLISYTMVNQTKENIYLNNYDIIVKDKNKEKLTKIAAHVTQTLSPKKSVDMANQVVGIDLTDAYYMELIINTEKDEE
jgi:hypothetical protein